MAKRIRFGGVQARQYVGGEFGVTVHGQMEVAKRLDKLRQDFPALFRQCVRNEMEVVFSRSQLLVPVRTGNLRLSGALYDETPPGFATMHGWGSTDPNRFEVSICYDCDYATDQHENLNYHHTSGQAKYLEKPLKGQTRGMKARIENTMRTYLNTGVLPGKFIWFTPDDNRTTAWGDYNYRKNYGTLVLEADE